MTKFEERIIIYSGNKEPSTVIKGNFSLRVGQIGINIFSGCVTCKTNNFFPVVMEAWRWCLNLNKEQAISIH